MIFHVCMVCGKETKAPTPDGSLVSSISHGLCVGECGALYLEWATSRTTLTLARWLDARRAA